MKSEPSEEARTRARELAQTIIIDCSLNSGRADSTWLDGRFKHNLTNRLVDEIAARDAEIEELKQQLASPRARSKKQKIEDELRQSDLTAQLTGRDDIEWGHHESLPRGEHVANPRK